MRVLTRDESAVFFYIYLRPASFCHVCSPRPSSCAPLNPKRVKVVIGEPFESQLKILQMANLCKYNLRISNIFRTFGLRQPCGFSPEITFALSCKLQSF